MKKLEDLFNKIKKQEISFFVGAGISFNSKVPVVNQILSAFIESFNGSEEDVEYILSNRIPFESFIEYMFYKSNKFDKFLSIFSGYTSNENHYLLALLHAKGYLKNIYTTNFDTLIENAFAELNIPIQTLYNTEHFNNVKLENTCLFKIHGSISDKKSIITTISSILKPQYVEARKKALCNIVKSDKCLIFMGYSFSDIFDIIPFFEKEIRNKEIYIIDHTGSSNTTYSDIKDYKIFKNCTGKIIHTNTNYFVECFYKSFEFEFIKNRHKKKDYKNIIKSLFANVEVPLKYLYLSNILRQHNNIPKANYYLEKSLRLSQKSSTDYFHIELSRIVNLVSNYKKKQELLNELYTIAKTSENKYILKIQQATALYGAGEIDNSIQILLNIPDDLHNKQDAQRKFQYYQITLGVLIESMKYKKAFYFMHKAKKEAIESGYLYGIAIVYNNLALLLIKNNKMKLALIFLFEAERIGRSINNYEILITTISLKPVVYDNLSYGKELKQSLKEHIKIAETFNDKFALVTLNINLAKTSTTILEKEKFINKAINISKEINDNIGLIEGLSEKIALQIDSYRNYKCALNLINESLDLIKKSELNIHVEYVRNLYYNKGLVNYFLKSYKESKESFEKALKCDEQHNLNMNIRDDLFWIKKISNYP